MDQNWFKPSMRAQLLTRSRYNRPLNDEETVFESWDQTNARVINHQRWLWEMAQEAKLSAAQEAELLELSILIRNRAGLPSGRTLWLGGTELVKKRAASMFNCSHLEVRTVNDLVDALWLLLQGCGVGFKPASGVLTGFVKRMEISVIRSSRTEKGGVENNVETFDQATKTWTIKVGDSAEAWAKSIGKIVCGKFAAKKLVLDFSEIRPKGLRLKGYGWLCSGDDSIALAYTKICEVMNRFSGKLLTKFAIWDIMNWLGTVLSSRRSAQIGLVDHGDPEWEAIAQRKYKGFSETDDWYRGQSNNTVLFHERPKKRTIAQFFEMMLENGGSEPGIANAVAAKKRAPWFIGFNPCAEILLASHSFCNLTEIDLGKFVDNHEGLMRAAWIIGRANYRQTCVNLRDGILQEQWHQNNEYLRLCGVGLTGICRREDMSPWDYRQVRYSAITGAYSMADELGMERPKNVTTVKPSGTLSKIMDTTEGAHRPKSRHILNEVMFSHHDPLVPLMESAGYRIRPHPKDSGSLLVTIPTPQFSGTKFSTVEGHEIDTESAVDQLNRYKRLMTDYVDQNCSITVSYTPDQIPQVVDWMDRNWEDTVAVSFLLRDDPFKTAEDLGYAYLPQKVVTAEEYHSYADSLKDIDLSDAGSMETQLLEEPECAGGACPTR